VSFLVEVTTGAGDGWSSNGLRFQSAEEAELYAQDLYRRWTAVDEYRVTESTDLATHRIEDGKAVKL
jgi:hypothetical protein